MSDASDASTIQRKAGAGRPPPDVQVMSAAKALRLALARTAEDEIGLAISVNDFTELRVPLKGIPDELPENGLIAMLSAEDNARGLLVLDCSVLAALIEQMTTGSVRHTQAEEREPTATDAVLVSSLIDKLMERFERLVAEAAAPPDVGGYRFEMHLRDPRAIGLTLADQRYRFYRLTLDLGLGAKTGDMLLMMPLERPLPEEEGRKPAANWEEKLQRTVSSAEVVLEGVLHRIDLPLSAVMNFEVGTLIPVPRKTVGAVEVEGVDGRVVAHARLGQANGLRALRVRLDMDEEDDDVIQGQAMPAEGLGDMPAPGALPPLGGEGLPPLGGGDLPPLGAGGLPPLGEGGLPPLGGEDLPPLGGGDLPPLGGEGLPPLGEGGLPPLGDDGELPSLGGDLPPLGGDFPSMGGDLPPLGDGAIED